jgi:hypothetical protein
MGTSNDTSQINHQIEQSTSFSDKHQVEQALKRHFLVGGVNPSEKY